MSSSLLLLCLLSSAASFVTGDEVGTAPVAFREEAAVAWEAEGHWRMDPLNAEEDPSPEPEGSEDPKPSPSPDPTPKPSASPSASPSPEQSPSPSPSPMSSPPVKEELGEVFELGMDTYRKIKLYGPHVTVHEENQLQILEELIFADTVESFNLLSGASLTVKGKFTIKKSVTFAGQGWVVFVGGSRWKIEGGADVIFNIQLVMVEGSRLRLNAKTARLILDAPAPQEFRGANVQGDGTLVLASDGTVMAHSKVQVNIIHYSTEPFVPKGGSRRRVLSTNHRRLAEEEAPLQFFENIGVHQILCNTSVGAVTTNKSTALIVDTSDLCMTSDLNYIDLVDDSTLVFRNFTPDARTRQPLKVNGNQAFKLAQGSTTKVWFADGKKGDDVEGDEALVLITYNSATCAENGDLVVGQERCEKCSVQHVVDGSSCRVEFVREADESSWWLLSFAAIPAGGCLVAMCYQWGRVKQQEDVRVAETLAPAPMSHKELQRTSPSAENTPVRGTVVECGSFCDDGFYFEEIDECDYCTPHKGYHGHGCRVAKYDEHYERHGSHRSSRRSRSGSRSDKYDKYDEYDYPRKSSRKHRDRH